MYLIGSLFCIKGRILLDRQIADVLVCSMYLPDVVALLCTDKYVLGNLFPGKLLLIRNRAE